MRQFFKKELYRAIKGLYKDILELCGLYRSTTGVVPGHIGL